MEIAACKQVVIRCNIVALFSLLCHPLENIMSLSKPFTLSLLLCSSSVAVMAGPHEHGHARMDVAIDGARVEITLDSPLDNLAGFEHAPRTDKQRATLRQMATHLGAEEALRLNPEAVCRRTEIRVDHPFANAPKKNEPNQSAGEHADVETAWVFACEAPTLLRQLEIKLFERFSGLRSIKVQIAGPRGQTAAVATRKKHTVNW